MVSFRVYHNSIMINEVHGARLSVRKYLNYKGEVKGRLNRLCCCYSNLLCHDYDQNLFTEDWDFAS